MKSDMALECLNKRSRYPRTLVLGTPCAAILGAARPMQPHWLHVDMACVRVSFTTGLRNHDGYRGRPIGSASTSHRATLPPA
jgi:hypothetical protein